MCHVAIFKTFYMAHPFSAYIYIYIYIYTYIWPWGPPSLLQNGYRVFPGGRGGRCVGLTPPSNAEGPIKSRAIPLLTPRACVAYKKGETYLPIYIYIYESVYT